jgi:hypothetical protein
MEEHDCNMQPHTNKPDQRSAGLDQLICLALARPEIAQQLLQNPEAAIQQVDPIIQLSADERITLLAVHNAVDIHDLAARLHAYLHQTNDVKGK